MEEVTIHNTSISLLLSTSVWVLLSPPKERRETRPVAKEGRPKFNPRPGRGLNPGPSGWQSEILPTVPTSHTLKLIRAPKIRSPCNHQCLIYLNQRVISTSYNSNHFLFGVAGPSCSNLTVA